VPHLFPAEEVFIVRAVPRRREEFARGRGAARAALQALGIQATPIGVGSTREPLWPEGVVGSISHCPRLAWAAAASASEVAALGIDVEPETGLPSEVRTRVLEEGEAVSLAHATGTDVVGFGAKESIHKAVHPATGVWLDFHDVRVIPGREKHTLVAEPRAVGLAAEVLDLLERLEIRWAIQDGLVFTSAWALVR
jgi:4'-phosphopantetheinyl transferase EntD